MLEVLNLKDFDKVYDLMEVSFPRDEYRNYEDQKALLSDSSYIIYVVYDETRGIKAFMAVWDFDEYAFIEHFAVSPKFRNNGIGKEMLSQIAKVLGKRMCLEVEEPDTNMAKRRIGFYERNNFFLNKYPYIQPALSKERDSIPLLIMTTGAGLDEETFLNIKKSLYSKVYKVKSLTL